MTFGYQNGCNIIECVPPSYNSFTQNLRITWKYMRPFRNKMILSALIQLLSLIMEIAMPLVAAKVIVKFYNSAYTQIILMSVLYCIMQRIGSNINKLGELAGKFTWSTDGKDGHLSDPKKLRDMKPQEILKMIYGVI